MRTAHSSALPFTRDRLDEAKRRVPLSLAARALGLDLKKPNGVQRSPIRRPERFTFAIPHAVVFRHAWLAYVSHSENNPGEKTKAAALLAHWRKLRTEGPRRG